MCNASLTGAVINQSKIPIALSTKKICEYYNIDPLRLMSSGCMLISCSKGSELANLLSRNGIPASIIGSVTEDKKCSIVTDNGYEAILPPGPDELYKV
jgi:hydrogenase maturation factor